MPNSDDLLARLRQLGQRVRAGGGADPLTALQLFEAVDALDDHLSAGGTPPTSWSEGPDAPQLDTPLFDAGEFAGDPVTLRGQSIRDAHGATYTPWTNGWAVGLACSRGGRTDYLYLNPSSEDDEGVSTVFLYVGKDGDPAGPRDVPLTYVDVLRTVDAEG